MSQSTFGTGGSLEKVSSPLHPRALLPLFEASSQAEKCVPAGVFGTSGTKPCDSTTKIVLPERLGGPEAPVRELLLPRLRLS